MYHSTQILFIFMFGKYVRFIIIYYILFILLKNYSHTYYKIYGIVLSCNHFILKMLNLF